MLNRKKASSNLGPEGEVDAEPFGKRASFQHSPKPIPMNVNCGLRNNTL